MNVGALRPLFSRIRPATLPRPIRNYSKVIKYTKAPRAGSTPTPSPTSRLPTEHTAPSSAASTSAPASVTEAETSPESTAAAAEEEAEAIPQALLTALDSIDHSAWGTSYDGISAQPFAAHINEVLLQPLDPRDIEIKPDGIPYLPEIKYRRILNRSFGPGGWGLVPRGPHTLTERSISREYALICLGRFVSQARGEQDFFNPNGMPTASEGCKSNALMRCCKDLGIASELWDPAFIPKYKKQHCVEAWAVHIDKGNKKKVWRRKDRPLEYPWKEA